MEFKELSKKKVSEVEEEIIKSWGGINEITNRQNELRKNSKNFVFYDGPAFANGFPGLHHMVAKNLKDAISQPDGVKSIVPEASKDRQIEGIVWRLVDKCYVKNERIKQIDWSKIPEEKWSLVKEKSVQLETKKASFKCISNKYLLKNE